MIVSLTDFRVGSNPAFRFPIAHFRIIPESRHLGQTRVPETGREATSRLTEKWDKPPIITKV